MRFPFCLSSRVVPPPVDIMGCLGMLLFQSHDPFHYGSVQQALFTTYMIETLDAWDVIYRINMYGKYANKSEGEVKNTRLLGELEHLLVVVVCQIRIR